MSNQNINAHCSICGNGYHVCRSCAEQKTFKPWRTVTDTIEHYKIYMAIHGFTISKNKEKAKDELEKCNLTGLEEFRPEIQNTIKEILSKPKATKPVLKKEKADVNE